jgi:hypothetical protein
MPNTKKTNLLDFIVLLFTVTCLCLAIWSTNIYRSTFIEWKLLVPPIIIGALISSVIFWRLLTKIGYQFWARVFISFTCGACLTHFGFLYLNQKFAQTETITDLFNIDRVGKLAKGRSSCAEPYAVIHYKSLEKEIIFSCNLSEDLKEFSKIKIVFSKGFLGFEVIREKTLIKF